jgi:predicted anti-sigma-YlaC factor YlaD
MTMPWLAEAARRPAKSNSSNSLRALLSCEAVSEELPLVVDGSRRPSAAMDEHLRTCLACQAEMAGYRRLLKILRNMRGDPVLLPAPELVGSMLSVLRQHPSWRGRRTEPWLVAGAVAAIGVAAVGGRALFSRTSRHARLIAGAV